MGFIEDDFIYFVTTGIRPLGIVFIVETSISPYIEIASVRGIGVALIIKKST